MRLNKKRLAALAMSAVMAASAVPFPVYAEELSAGEDVVVSAETTVETPETDSTAITVTGATFQYKGENDYSGQWVYSDGSKKDIAKDDIKKENADASCTKGATVTLSAKDVNGKVWEQSFETSKALGHDMQFLRSVVLVEETCEHGGTTYDEYKCSRCSETEKRNEQQISKLEHVWGDEVVYSVLGRDHNIKLDAEGNVILGTDGLPQVVDKSKKGIYYTQKKCVNCKTLSEKEKHVIASTTIEYAVVTDTENIKTDLNKLTEGKNPSEAFPVAEADIELNDCSKEGSYVVNYYNSDDELISKRKITVAAHHYKTFKTAVFKTQADMDQAVVTREEDGSLKVTSKSCVNPIQYMEVTHCTASGCKEKDCDAAFELPNTDPVKGKVISSVEKTADVSGKHKIETAIKTKIDALVKAGNVKCSNIEEIIGKNKNVKLDVSADVCEKGGKVTVSYICILDKETVVEKQDINVIAEGHKIPQAGVVENEVKATCKVAGSFDSVKYCERCGKELERVSQKMPRLKHTNETAVGTPNVYVDKDATVEFVGNKVVDNKGALLEKKGEFISAYDFVGDTSKGEEFGVVGKIYTNCETCNDHKVAIADIARGPLTLKIKDIKKQNEKGQDGYIVLEATYTRNYDKTNSVVEVKFPYYSTMEAYLGRVEDSVINGLHKDKDGVYRYYVNGELQKDYTGMIEDNKEKYLVVKGVLATDINGLWHSDVDKVWYFFVEGHVLANYTGIALYDGEWFYVTNGKLDEGVTGLVPYDGGTFLFTDGRLRNDVNGLWQDINNPADWYFLALGQVQNLYSGVAQYDGAFFVVKNGKLDTSYNGTIKYDGETFKVVNGQLITK